MTRTWANLGDFDIDERPVHAIQAIMMRALQLSASSDRHVGFVLKVLRQCVVYDTSGNDLSVLQRLLSYTDKFIWALDLLRTCIEFPSLSWIKVFKRSLPARGLRIAEEIPLNDKFLTSFRTRVGFLHTCRFLLHSQQVDRADQPAVSLPRRTAKPIKGPSSAAHIMDRSKISVADCSGSDSPSSGASVSSSSAKRVDPHEPTLTVTSSSDNTAVAPEASSEHPYMPVSSVDGAISPPEPLPASEQLSPAQDVLVEPSSRTITHPLSRTIFSLW